MIDRAFHNPWGTNREPVAFQGWEMHDELHDELAEKRGKCPAI
jgi:hypothetical protein